jgi:hypothetical protein
MSLKESFPKSGNHESFADPDIQKVLDEVNFDFLRCLFTEYAVHSGIDPEDIVLVEPLNIKSVNSSALTAGHYNLKTKEIAFNEKGLNLAFKLDIESDKRARILSVLIHEQAHAFGGTSASEHSEDALLGLLKEKWETNKSGFLEVSAATTFSLKDPTEKFRWFNEGMVDESASEIYNEYLRREGVQPLDPEKSMDFKDMYPLARLFVRSLRDKISEESGVPPEVVWHSLIKLYAEGGDLLQGEVREALDEVFSKEFVDRLSSIRSSLSNPIATTLVFGEVLNRERVKSITSSLVDVLKEEFERKTK